MKVKIISSVDANLLEKSINQWLEDNNWVKIVTITQSSSNSLTFVSIWYQEPQVPILG